MRRPLAVLLLGSLAFALVTAFVLWNAEDTASQVSPRACLGELASADVDLGETIDGPGPVAASPAFDCPLAGSTLAYWRVSEDFPSDSRLHQRPLYFRAPKTSPPAVI